MVRVGDKVRFTKGKMGKSRNRWTVRFVGPGKSQRYVVVVKPLNGSASVMYLVIDCLYQHRTKEATRIPKVLDTDEEWARLIDDYVVGRRVMKGKDTVSIADIEGLNDVPERGE